MKNTSTTTSKSTINAVEVRLANIAEMVRLGFAQSNIFPEAKDSLNTKMFVQ